MGYAKYLISHSGPGVICDHGTVHSKEWDSLNGMCVVDGVQYMLESH